MKKKLLFLAGCLLLTGVPAVESIAAEQGTPECEAEATVYANRRAPFQSTFWFDYFYYYQDMFCTVP